MLRDTAPADAIAAPINPKKLRALGNDHLDVAFAPERGGKLLFLLSKRTETQWILPPLRPYAEAHADAGFDGWDGGGFDECLPTVAATATALDHGEVWRKQWLAENERGALTMSTTACGGNIAVHRRASLDGPSLVLEYSVKNIGQSAQSLLYSAHPLLRVEEGDRILLPEDVRSVAVEGSGQGRLGRRGTALAWPVTADGEDLSRVGPPDGSQADKLFADARPSGWCALFRPGLGEGIRISFDSDVLPYVGLWICRAAWPETGSGAKQYTVALEPASAPADSLADAEREGTAWRLAPGEERTWTMRVSLIQQTPIQQTSDTTPGKGPREGQ